MSSISLRLLLGALAVLFFHPCNSSSISVAVHSECVPVNEAVGQTCEEICVDDWGTACTEDDQCGDGAVYVLTNEDECSEDDADRNLISIDLSCEQSIEIPQSLMSDAQFVVCCCVG